MDDIALRPQLHALFARHPVRLAYIFGSQVSGRAHTESDVDVAVLLDPALTSDERFAHRLELIGELGQLFRTDHVDLVVLNEAPPLLAYEVLQGGSLLYCPDDAERVEFQVRTLREYEDTEPLRRFLSETLEQRIREGSFGKPLPVGRRGAAE